MKLLREVTQMKLNKTQLHKVKKILICAITSAVCINNFQGFTSIVAHERELIKNTSKYGEMFNKELNKM